MLSLTGILFRIWPYRLGGAAVIAAWLYADHRGYSRAEAIYTAQIAQLQADVRQKTAEAQAEDIDHARVIEQAQEQARSEEHTSELQSLMRTSYAVFCLKKKKNNTKKKKYKDNIYESQ